MEDGKQSAVKRIELLVTVVDRGLGDELTETLRESGVTFNIVSPATCAAGSDFKDYLGLTNPERDLILSVVTEDRVEQVLNKILYKFDLDKPGKGMAFSIPIAGVSGPLALRYISGMPDNV